MVWIRIYDLPTQAQEFPEIGVLKKKWVKGKEICVGRTSAGFFAIQNHCPHAGAELNFGKLVDDRVVCPFHHYAFDPLTGRSLPGQGEAVKVYPLEQRHDGLYIGIKTILERLRG